MGHTSNVVGRTPSLKGGGIRFVKHYAALFAIVASLASSALASAPSLTVGNVSGAAGTAVNLPLSFDPSTSSVAGIQFNLILPSALSSGTVTPGSIVTNAGKSVSTSFTNSSWTFIIFGFNTTTISSGTLLTAQVNIAPGTPGGILNVPVTTLVYSDPNGISIPPGATIGGTVTVLASTPVITSSLTATGVIGSTFSYQITASNSPTSFNATPLPAGLSVNTVTGLISGTPTTAGVTNVKISATNAAGTGSKTLVLTINPAPNITLTKTTSASTGKSGDTVTFTIKYQNTTTGIASNVTITDVIPTGTTFVAGSITGGGTLSGNTITWALGTIAGGASGQVSFQVKVN
jgi:uncharacterized repeat protein (TIGR01451 family)